VDITNPHHNFTTEEWEKLGPKGQKLTLDLCDQEDGKKHALGGRFSGQGCSVVEEAATIIIVMTLATPKQAILRGIFNRPIRNAVPLWLLLLK
jgi:hypothetical protein